MVQKRHFNNEKDFEVPSKHPRQLDNADELVSFSEIVFPHCISKKHHSSGDDESIRSDVHVDEKLTSSIIIQHPESTKDVETSNPASISFSSWYIANNYKEDSGLEPHFHAPFFSEYFNREHPEKTLAPCQDIYSLLLDSPPRKPVPVGENHQADVPAWGSWTAESTDHIATSEAVWDAEVACTEEDVNMLMGTCIIPMPDFVLSESDTYEVGKGRLDCSCEDEGSIRCVRQHIMEAREKLKKSLGQERFVELGFCEMGEFVAEKWSDEEQQLFHMIASCNPASTGQNLWGNHSGCFPSRTMKDIVNYYFNVFMLRRRSEQNRYDHENIDSDDDEWQENDDDSDTEHGTSDEDYDSVIESTGFQGDFCHLQDNENDFDVYLEVADEACHKVDKVDYDAGKSASTILETYPEKLLPQLQDKVSLTEKGDNQLQNGSCTSSGGGALPEGTQMKAETGHLSGTGNGHGFGAF